MSERTPAPDVVPPLADSETHPAAHLQFVCVEYDGDPDRCTVYPRESDRTELTTTWLTADRGAFVDLSAVE